MAVLHWAPCTGHCICYCFPKHHGSFMYRNSAGSPALFSLSPTIYSLLPRRKEAFSCRKSLLAPLIGVPLCAFYCTFGDILSNLLWCGMMILVSYRSIHGLVYAETQTGKRTEPAVFSHRNPLLCCGRIHSVDLRLLLAGRLYLQSLLLV